MKRPLSGLIRPMEARDLDRVVEIAKNLKTAPQWPRGAYASALDESASPRRIALVAFDPASVEIVGFAISSLTPPEAELEVIAVVPEFQRQGIAGRLFAAVESELATLQVTGILLEVRPSNAPALGLYRSLGFVEAGRRKAYYVDPVEDALILRHKIG